MKKIKHLNHQAFTLLEIIITIAIVGVLASVVFLSIDPAQRLSDTEECIRDNNALAMQKELELFLADQNSTPAALEELENETYYMIVTAEGDTSGLCECATLDEEIGRIDLSGILEGLPVDDSATADDTGYYIFKNSSSYIIGSCNAAGDTYEAQGYTCGAGHTDNLDGTCSAEITASVDDGYMSRSDCQTASASASTKNTSWTSLVITSGDDEGAELARSYIYFDTSAIPIGSTINSASLKLVKTLNPASRTMTINVQGHSTGQYPSSALALTDFNSSLYDITNGGSFTSAQMTLNAYSTHSLTAGGLDIIQTGEGAISKFVLRDSADVGGTCMSVWLSTMYIASANNAGKEPKLLVTYTPL